MAARDDENGAENGNGHAESGYESNLPLSPSPVIDAQREGHGDDTVDDAREESWRVYCQNPNHAYAISTYSKGTAEHLMRIHNRGPGGCSDPGASVEPIERPDDELECAADGCTHVTERRCLVEREQGLVCLVCGSPNQGRERDTDSGGGE
jgi:hypothetical protein